MSRLTITWNSGVRREVALLGQAGEDGLEGHVLVRIGTQGDLPHPRHQLAEAGPAAKVGAQDQGIQEAADQALGLARRGGPPPERRPGCRPGRCGGAAEP